MVEKKNPCFECLGEVATFLAKLERGVYLCHVLEREGLPLPWEKEEREGEKAAVCASSRGPLGLTLCLLGMG